MENEKKNNKGLIITIVVLSVLVILLIGYISYDKFLSGNNNENNQSYSNNNTQDNEDTNNNENTEIDNSANLDFDFNELSNTLHSYVQKNNITTLISNCQSKNVNAGDPPESEYKNTEVSTNTIDIIIKKLKTAKSIDKDVTYSWSSCPPKSVTYYISVNSNDQSEVHSQKVFSLNYADSNDTLLVSYNKKGYAFHFNSSEEINNFIETLK